MLLKFYAKSGAQVISNDTIYNFMSMYQGRPTMQL